MANDLTTMGDNLKKVPGATLPVTATTGAGATIGTLIFPGVGTAVGAAVGAVAGALITLAGAGKGSKK